jgi:hypothetical protein
MAETACGGGKMNHIEMLERELDQKREPKPKTYTLEEIAQKICDSYKYCTEDCPGFEYCRHDKKGVLVWLKTILKSEPNT